MDETAPFVPDVDYGAFSRALSAAAVDFAEMNDEVSATSLSGGQQARLALARAMYQAETGSVCACVLDDVTAALDPQVTLQVINNCLNGPLQDMATLLVSSDPGPWLQRCDRIIVMSPSSDTGSFQLQVDFAGSYAALAESGRLELSLPQAQPEPTVAVTEEAEVSEPKKSFEDPMEVSEEGSEGTEEKPKSKQITEEEARASGAVPLKLYARYFQSARSPLLLGLAVVAVIASYGATAAQQWWIGLWTADATMKRGLGYYMLGVIFWGLLASGLTFGRSLLIAAFSRRASRAVHDDLCEKVLVRASTSHFDRNPSSRLLQNFSKDLEQIDNSLPNSLRSAVSSVTTLAGAAVTIVLATPSFAVIMLPLLWLYTRSLQYYRPVARELKRLEPLARSPVYAEQAAAASGVITIRKLGLGNVMAVRVPAMPSACPAQAPEFSDNSHHLVLGRLGVVRGLIRFLTSKARALRAIDSNTAVSFAAKAVDRWFSLRMELLGNIIVLAAALLSLWTGANAGAWAAARAAIAVTQALSVCGLLNWTVRTIAQTETSFTSFQRISDSLSATELEASRELPADAELPSAWPVSGSISFEDVSFSYRKHLPPVLRGLSLDLAAGKRIGVVGRTGSGKSTLLRLLLRTVEVSEGSVKVDGVDLRQVGLARLRCEPQVFLGIRHDSKNLRLRSSVTAIPQDNFLVTGTVRENVDPRGSYSDEEVRHALQAASLGNWDLERRVSASGGISPGEKQLIGVARAVLRKSRIVALDEVTSRVDKGTDEKVQSALKRLPEGTTLLVVSHRLATLQDYDTVVVLGDGHVVEIGNPKDLESNPESQFASMLAAEQSGEIF